MSSRVQNLIVVLGLLVVAALGYFLYTQNQNSVLSLGTDVVTTQAALENQDFLNKLNELQAITLDDSLFSDPRFQSFINFRPPVIEESVGRENPFLEVEDTNL